MNGWLGLIALAVAFLISIYLIAKGVEVTLRGTKASNPNRNLDLLVGLVMLIPGILIGAFGYFWLVPRLQL